MSTYDSSLPIAGHPTAQTVHRPPTGPGDEPANLVVWPWAELTLVEATRWVGGDAADIHSSDGYLHVPGTFHLSPDNTSDACSLRHSHLSIHITPLVDV